MKIEIRLQFIEMLLFNFVLDRDHAELSFSGEHVIRKKQLKPKSKYLEILFK